MLRQVVIHPVKRTGGARPRSMIGARGDTSKHAVAMRIQPLLRRHGILRVFASRQYGRPNPHRHLIYASTGRFRHSSMRECR